MSTTTKLSAALLLSCFFLQASAQKQGSLSGFDAGLKNPIDYTQADGLAKMRSDSVKADALRRIAVNQVDILSLKASTTSNSNALNALDPLLSGMISAITTADNRAKAAEQSMQTVMQTLQTAGQVSMLIASYLSAHPVIQAMGSNQLAVALAVNATAAISIVYDKPMPGTAYSIGYVLPPGVTLNSITAKTTTGCTLNITAKAILATGANFIVSATQFTP